MNEILEYIFEKKNDELIPVIKYYKDDITKINKYIFQLLDYLKKKENSEIKTSILEKLKELIVKNFDIYLILTSPCIVNELNQNLFDILIELYLFNDDNNELILEILRNINKNIEVNKKTINSIFQTISLNYQKKKCDVKQYQKYLNLLNLFYIETEKTIENYFIFNNSNANNYGIRIKNPIFSLKNDNILYKIQINCIFEKFHENDGTLLSFIFENSENIFSINYTNEGQLYYKKYLNLTHVDRSTIFNIAQQSLIPDEEQNKNQDENDEQKIFLHHKIPLNIKIILNFTFIQTPTENNNKIYYLNLIINEKDNKNNNIQEDIEIKDDLNEKNIKGVILLQHFQGKLYSFRIINPQKRVDIENISNQYIKDTLSEENLSCIYSYFLPEFFDPIKGKIIDPFQGIKAKIHYSFSKLNYNLVKYTDKYNLFQLGGLSIFLPLFEMMINIENNYEIFKNFMEFISNIFQMVINNDKKEDKYFLFYDEKFFPVFSLLLQQFTGLILTEKIFFNFILVCNSLLTSYRQSYSFHSFTQWLTFNYRFAIKFGENIQKEINDYMKQLFYSNNKVLLNKNIIYSFFHQLSRFSKPDKEFYFQDVLLYILNQENTDNITKIMLMHLIKEKNTKTHIRKTILEAFIKHFKIELNNMDNKNKKYNIKDNQTNENVIKSILKKMDLLKMLINVDILKDLRNLFIENDDEIKVKIIKFIYIIFFSYTSLLEIKYINSKEPSINDYQKSKHKDLDLDLDRKSLIFQKDIEEKVYRHSNLNPLMNINDILTRSIFHEDNDEEINTDKENLNNHNDSINNSLYGEEQINQTVCFINAIYNNLNQSTKENIIKRVSVTTNIEINENSSFDVLLNWFFELKEFENWQKKGIIITPLFIEDLFFDYCNSIKESKKLIKILKIIISEEKKFNKLVNCPKFLLFFSKIYYENFKLISGIESNILLGNEEEKKQLDSLITDIFLHFFNKKYIFNHLKDIILNIIVFIIKDAENIHEKIKEISELLISLIKTTYAQYTGNKSKREELYYCYYIILYYSLFFLDTKISNQFKDFEKIMLSQVFITIFDLILYKLVDNKEFQNNSYLEQTQTIDIFQTTEITDIINEQIDGIRDISSDNELLLYIKENINLHLITIITIFIQRLIKLIQKTNNYSQEIEKFYLHLLRNYHNLIIILIFNVYKKKKDKNPILEEVILYNIHEIFINKDYEKKNNNEEIKIIYNYFVLNIVNLLLALLYKNENEKTQKLIIFKTLLKIYYDYEKSKTDDPFGSQSQKKSKPYICYSEQNLNSFPLVNIKNQINILFNEQENCKKFYNEKNLQENIISLFNKISNLIKPSKKFFSIYKMNIQKNYSKLFEDNFNEKIISNYSRIEEDYYLNTFDNNKQYRKLKKRLFSWNNSYSNFEDFYINREIKIKFKNKYYFTKNLTQPLLTPIIDLFSYTPNFSFIQRDKNFFLNQEYYLIPIKNYLQLNPYFCPYYFKHGYNCCIVKLLYHIRGKLKIEDSYIEFYSVSIKDDDAKLLLTFDEEKKTCLGSIFKNSHKDTLYYLKINFSDIKYIFSRKYCLIYDGIEIFTKNNKSYYIVFQDNNEFKMFNDNFISLSKKNLIYQKNSQMKFYNNELKTKFPKNPEEIKKLWNERLISNFDFLIWINVFGNRSYRDIYQYPIMPWIIEDLQIEKKLENEIDYISYLESNQSQLNIFRNLSIPLGMNEHKINGKRRKAQYIINFRASIEELNSSNYGFTIICKTPNYNFNQLITNDYSSIDHIEIPEYNIDYEKLYLDKRISLTEIPYYFGSHYSNPAYISHYLTRIYPFCFSALEIQGYSFDAPDRLFINICKCYNSVINEKSDVREIIPQFFYFPEMFININKLDFGYLQNAENINNSTCSIVLNLEGIFDPQERKNKQVQVPNVLLPYWSQNNPYKFISIHRQILEENFIYINHWVDLMFGEKQRGEKAAKIGNLFMPYSYEGALLNKDLNRDELKMNIKLIDYGICAHKIFNEKIEDRKIDNKTIIYFNKNRKNDDILNLPSNIKRGMIYNNNKDFLNIINPGKNNEDTFNKVKALLFKFYVAYHFGEKNEYLLVGGFLKEVMLFYNFQNVTEFVEIKKSNLMLKYKDNSVVTCIEITENDTLAFLGTELGNIIVYDINLNQNHLNKKLTYKAIICHHTNRINYINSNLNLQLLIDCSADGYINIYTINNFELVNSIFIFPHEFFVDFAFLSSFPLNCFVLYSKESQLFRSYSLNGKLISDEESEIIINIKNDDEYIVLKDKIEFFYDKDQNKNNMDVKKNISPFVFVDGDLKEYLIYNTKTGLKFRKLPFLEIINIEQSKIIIN